MVIKRDGSKVEFDKTKIIDAINKAYIDISGKEDPYKVAYDIAEYVSDLHRSGNDLTVEEIQDIVVSKLIEKSKTYLDRKVAEAYITYRYKRAVARDRYSEFMVAMSEKLSAKNVENQNANVDERSFGGRMGEASRVMMKQFALDNILSDKSRFLHEENIVYIHDLDNYALGNHNCLSVPFDDLLANGFNTRQSDVRPAQSVNTAMQLVAVIFQLQSLQQFGGVSATHLDWTMVPYVRKSFVKHWRDGYHYIAGCKDELDWEYLSTFDIYSNHFTEKFPAVFNYAMDMTEKEVYQAVEALYHNLNTLQSRSGNQLPFTSINYGSCTLPEGRMISKALLETSIKGNGKLHKTSVFPCGIFQLGEGINRKPGDLNYDLFKLALKSTARRLYPNYANLDWSGNAGYDKNDPKTYFSTMGCRTANGWDINGLGQQKDGRGNICPVTIILPTVAMNIKEDVDKYCEKAGIDIHTIPNAYERLVVNSFLSYLEAIINAAKDMLIERFEYICSQDAASAKFMYENNLMAGYIPEEGIRSALKHGTLAVGQLGLAECLQILIGCDHTTKKGMDIAKKIEQVFKDKCAQFKEEYKLNFGVYFTPAENLCHTALVKFRDRYGVIPNVSDREYFTNSIHVPVWHNMTATEKIDIESQLTGYSSAGCITYIELDSAAKYNIEALETLVDYAMDKDIPYFAINVPNDQCMDCGYTEELLDSCPMCGSKNIQRLRRVTGYLTGNYTTAFNWGKQKEVEDRVKHERYKMEEL